MRINKISLRNYRCFRETEFEFASQCNLIVGENASGKTAILDALAILASAVLTTTNRASERNRAIEDRDVRQESYMSGQTLNLEAQYPAIVWGHGSYNQEALQWGCGRPADRPTDWSDARPLIDFVTGVHKQVRDGDSTELPVVAYFGTERLVQKKATAGSNGPGSRLNGYRRCINPATDYGHLNDWFRDQTLTSLQKDAEVSILEACRMAVKTCIPDSGTLHYDGKLKELAISVRDEMRPLSQLSDGYRTVLAVVADIAIRCGTLNPHLGRNAALETGGIVLIDEIDLHLHPRWQRSVIPSLLRAFPKVQFVVTTHSPFVIQSLPNDPNVQLINLDDPTEKDVQNKSIEDISEWIQGVELPQRSQRYVQMMDKASQYFAMLKDEAATTEGQRQEARRELEQPVMPFSDSPGYQALIRMQELAAKKDDDNSSAAGGIP